MVIISSIVELAFGLNNVDKKVKLFTILNNFRLLLLELSNSAAKYIVIMLCAYLWKQKYFKCRLYKFKLSQRVVFVSFNEMGLRIWIQFGISYANEITYFVWILYYSVQEQ